MSFTPPPAAPPESVPIPNRRNDAQPVFDSKTDTYLNWQASFRNWLAVFVAWLTTYIAELTSALSGAEGNKNAAQAAAAAAEVSAQNAAVIAGAVRWVAGNYTKGDPVWSPISLLTYRRIPEGLTASAVDPANDPAGWRLTGSPHSMPQKEITTALDPVTGLPHLLSAGIHYTVTHPNAVLRMPDAVVQEQVRVEDQSGGTTVQIWPEPGGKFRNRDVALLLSTRGFDKTFTKTVRGWS